MHNKFIFIFFVITFIIACVQKKNESLGKVPQIVKLNEHRLLKTTEDSLYGVWINDDTTEQHRMEFSKGWVTYYDAHGSTGKRKYFIGNKCIDNKDQLTNITKSGGYLIFFSTLIDDIDGCQRIDTLSANKLTLFDSEVGKYGEYIFYHR